MKPPAQFADLTDGQKACLRLVVDYHTSKEISRILGISPFTVDQRLDVSFGHPAAAIPFLIQES